MFLNNLGGLHRPNWVNPIWGHSLLANQAAAYPYFGSQNQAATYPYFGSQVPCGIPHTTTGLPTSVPYYATLGNQGCGVVLISLVPQTIAPQAVNPFPQAVNPSLQAMNTFGTPFGTPFVPSINTLPFQGSHPFLGQSGLGTSHFGQGFNPFVAGISNPFLGCC